MATATASGTADTLVDMSDEQLISSFYRIMTEDLPAPVSPTAQLVVHAELLHRICLADGLLEVLEWTKEGTAADPLACMWLASLRWYRLVTGSYPDSAPEPPARQTDAALEQLLDSGLVDVEESSGESSRRALASGQLHYPSAPAQPQDEDQQVLLRLRPLALVPFIDDRLRQQWLEQNLAMTHGSTAVLQAGRQLVADLHERATAPSTSSEQPDDPDAARQPGSHPLFEVVNDLWLRWKRVSAAP